MDIQFILVRPRNSGNVGSAVRVLRNFGFEPPRIVDMYRFSPDEARQLAAGCEADIDGLQFFPTLDAALADRAFVIGTTAQKRSRWHLAPVDEGVPRVSSAQWKHAAILFGNEKSGLSEEELTRCEEIWTVPTRGYPSLNLSHAVGVVAWEIRRQDPSRRKTPAPELAPREVVDPMFDQMFQSLEKISFLHPGQDERVRAILRQLFSRNGLTRRDVQVLRGIWHQVAWLAGRYSSSSQLSASSSSSSIPVDSSQNSASSRKRSRK
jgi:TrmH family RNA methyltransferase